jgi:hypothetical protein
VFIAALVTTAKSGNQVMCPSADEKINKMLYLYTLVYYSSIKKNKILSFAGKWVELEIIMLSEIS